MTKLIVEQLTTSQAADFLGISRPTLVKMLEEGEIPYEKPRRHRKVYLKDLIAYKEEQYKKREQALTELAIQAKRLGFYE